MGASVPQNVFELPPSSHLNLAKDKYDRQPGIFFFCLRNYTTTNHINSLMPGGDRRSYILREIEKLEVCFSIYDLLLPIDTKRLKSF